MNGLGLWRSFLAGGAGFLLLASGASAAPENALKPREISAAERAAVELAVAYLHGGAEAWLPRLDASSSLGRLPREEARQEILARVGPADGAIWQLLTPGQGFDAQTAVFGIEYASGLDETLTLRLVDQGGWKISEIRTSVDRVEPGAAAWQGVAQEATPGPPPPSAPSGFQLSLSLFLYLGGALCVLILGSLGSFRLARRGRRPAAIAVATLGAMMALALAGWWFFGGSSPGPSGADGGGGMAGFVRLAPLAPLRTAMAAGTDRAEIDRLLAAPPADPALRSVHDLWKAHHLLAEADLATAEGLLGRFPAPAPYPLADLLRARLAFRRLQRESTGKAYKVAIANGLDTDGLRLETVSAQVLTDDVTGAEVSVALMTDLGTRLAQAWYAAAQVALSQDRTDEAESLLRTAWALEPVTRDELFGEPLLASLVARPKLFPLFALDASEEPRPAPTGARDPLPLPAGTRSATCGQSLRLAVRNAELLVPGGARLAPEGSLVEDARAWSRHREARSLAALPALTASAASGEILPPRRLRLAEEAGSALAEQNRWDELIDLTAWVSTHVERAPATLVRLRAQALCRVGRLDEARQLLLRLAGSDIASRRPAPGTLFELAELFAAAGEYDIAIRLSKKADSQLPEPRGERRRKQLELEKELAASYASYRSPHFDVRYPRATSELYARGVSLVLEEERRRLLHWIPDPGSKRIEVHLFPLREFFASFGSANVVGVYDGKVRVPFADLQSLDPALVAILSHELAHAMIAGATRDHAPHWFQEGLAQHVEMGLGRLNPLPDLARNARALSFPTLEPILSGFAEPQLVDLGYAESAWAVHFLEARFGVPAIHRLLAAFAAGRTTEQAIEEVCGLSPAALDRSFWQWGTQQAPRTRNLEVRRYDQAYDRKLVREGALAGDVTAREGGQERLDPQQELRRQMSGWHARYKARTVGVKEALKPILDSYEPGGAPIILEICMRLKSEALRALGELPLWTSPDGNVNRSLRSAYQSLAQAGKACEDGRGADTRRLIDRANAQLGEAARYLQPYEMMP